MEGIRPARPADLGQLMALHRAVWGGRRGAVTGAERHLGRLFFEAPGAGGDPPPLVWLDGAGRVAGCLGLLAGRMAFHDQPLHVAIGHSFMVDPRARGSLAGVALLRAALAGPQDLTLAQSPEPVARLWERLGGLRLPSFSARWTQVLSPSRFALARVVPPAWPLLGPSLGRGWTALDRLLTRRARLPEPSPPATGRTEALTVPGMLAALRRCAEGHAIRPDYDPAALNWALAELAGRSIHGTLRQAMVLGARDEPLGWFLYLAGRRAIAEVVQIAAAPRDLETVVGHLRGDAAQRGMVALSGQLEPRLLPALSGGLTLLHPAETWVLAHSRHPDVVQALRRGDAFLSRLDGEWWLFS